MQVSDFVWIGSRMLGLEAQHDVAKNGDTARTNACATLGAHEFVALAQAVS